MQVTRKDTIMPVTPMIPRVSSKHKYHFEDDPLEVGQGWKFRPGINARQLFSDFEGYRVTLLRFGEASEEPEGLQSGDEHVFVISGQVFIDSVEYGPGSYILNPAGISPSIYTLGGCSMIIHRLPVNLNRPKLAGPGKLESRTLLETQVGLAFPVGAGWEELRKGVFMLPLFEGAPGNYKSALQRFLPGASLPEHIHMGDEHTYILSGSLEDETGSYDTGGYVFNPIGTNHQVWTEEGCLALVHWRAPVRYFEDWIQK
jgi:quercetin dioxygenase-like cupin family protein